jgi:hypothetical protein
MAGQLGLPQDLWSHLPPEQEEGRLIDYCVALLDTLGKNGRALEDHLDFIEDQQGAQVDNVVRLPVRR